jgi:hypothetical protein
MWLVVVQGGVSLAAFGVYDRVSRCTWLAFCLLHVPHFPALPTPHYNYKSTLPIGMGCGQRRMSICSIRTLTHGLCAVMTGSRGLNLPGHCSARYAGAMPAVWVQYRQHPYAIQNHVCVFECIQGTVFHYTPLHAVLDYRLFYPALPFYPLYCTVHLTYDTDMRGLPFAACLCISV